MRSIMRARTRLTGSGNEIGMSDAPSAHWPWTRWGVSALEDQKLGGIIMWIPGHLAFLVLLTIVFFRWARAEAEGVEAGPARVEPRDPDPRPKAGRMVDR